MEHNNSLSSLVNKTNSLLGCVSIPTRRDDKQFCISSVHVLPNQYTIKPKRGVLYGLSRKIGEPNYYSPICTVRANNKFGRLNHRRSQLIKYASRLEFYIGPSVDVSSESCIF